jgi:N utilization substance protein B
VATRRAARERALGLAYESELRGLSAAALLAELPVEPDEYARRIVLGADDHRDEIDALIRKYSEHWSLERMPVIDRALLRLGTYELAWVIETPKGAVITEAVELAKQYSTKDSGRFVNGLLARISAEVRPEDVHSEEVRPEDVDTGE